MTDIVVVALNIHINDGGFKKFEALTALEKIALLKNRINAICKELSVSKPDTLWIIAWREYGITECGSGSRSISYDLKKLYKLTLLELTCLYPNLIILAGTVSTHKHVTDMKKLTAIKSHYQAQKHIKLLEYKSEVKKRQMQLAEEKVDILIKKNVSDDATKTEQIESIGFDVLRNTTYLVHGQVIQHHDKTTPFNETLANTAYSEAIYKPGKGSNKRTIFDVAHESTGRQLKLGVEICREHHFGVLKREVEGSKDKPPVIHFVLSDSIALQPEKFSGEYVIHLDSMNKPYLICHQPGQSDIKVELCQNNLLSEDTAVVYPMQLAYQEQNRSIVTYLSLFHKKQLKVKSDDFSHASHSM